MPESNRIEDMIKTFTPGQGLIDRSENLVLVDKSFRRMFGLADDALNLPVKQIDAALSRAVKDLLQSQADKRDLELIKHGKKLRLTLQTIYEKGVPVSLIVSAWPLETLEDLSNRLTSLNDLRLRLEGIMELSSDGIWVSDGKGNVISINKASEVLMGIKAEEVVGRNMHDLLAVGLVDHSVTLQVLKERRQVNMLQHVSRTNRYLLLTGTPLFDEKGEISMVVVNERDMTQLNALKQKIQQNKLLTKRIKAELAELSTQELRHSHFVAESESTRLLLSTADKLASMNVSHILITGESGTGKGYLAKYLHDSSPRSDKPFVQINCAAIPESLLEAELFGYEKGAFTGSSEQGKAGLFELAEGGTLFLDEIGEASQSTQAKLLKYLDDFEVMRLGGTKSRVIKCSIVAATNRNLQNMVRNRNFRQDLYYRLSTFTIYIPPLRERSEDTLELIRHFMAKYCKQYEVYKTVSAKAVERILSHNFPGNVRELENIIKKAVVLSPGEVIDASLMESIKEAQSARPLLTQINLPKSLPEELKRLERSMLHDAAQKYKSTRAMARHLGISQTSVVRKMKQYRLFTRSTQ